MGNIVTRTVRAIANSSKKSVVRSHGHDRGKKTSCQNHHTKPVPITLARVPPGRSPTGRTGRICESHGKNRGRPCCQGSPGRSPSAQKMTLAQSAKVAVTLGINTHRKNRNLASDPWPICHNWHNQITYPNCILCLKKQLQFEYVPPNPR